MSGWSKGRRVKDTRRLNPNDGLFCRLKALVFPADGLLSVESKGVGAESFSCAQGGLFFIPLFTSLPSQSILLCFPLFG